MLLVAVAPKLRADAARNVEAILDAALEVLAERPDASVGDIAEAAGLVRATVYAHFPNREALVRALFARLMQRAGEAIDASRPDEGSAAEALDRLSCVSWRAVSTVGEAREAIERTLGVHELHRMREGLAERHRRLVERGQASGEFRDDLPAAWLAEVFVSLMGAVSTAVREGKISAEDAPQHLRRTIFSAYGIAEPPPRELPCAAGDALSI